MTIKEKKRIIATATYGSEISGEVNLLRGFRDNIVLNSFSGQCFYKAFNAFYYSWSPYIAQIIHKNSWLKTPFEIILYPLNKILLLATYIVEPVTFLGSEFIVYLAGTIISIMLGTVYLLPMLLIFCRRYSFKLDRKKYYTSL